MLSESRTYMRTKTEDGAAAAPPRSSGRASTANPARESRASRGSRWSTKSSRESSRSSELAKAILDESPCADATSAAFDDGCEKVDTPPATFDVEHGTDGKATPGSDRWNPGRSDVQQCPAISHDCPENVLFLLILIGAIWWWAETTYARHTVGVNGTQPV